MDADAFECDFSRAAAAAGADFSADAALAGLAACAPGRFLAAAGFLESSVSRWRVSGDFCLDFMSTRKFGEKDIDPLFAGGDGPTQGAPK